MNERKKRNEFKHAFDRETDRWTDRWTERPWKYRALHYMQSHSNDKRVANSMLLDKTEMVGVDHNRLRRSCGKLASPRSA